MKKKGKILLFTIVALIAALIIWKGFENEDSIDIRIACNIPTLDCWYKFSCVIKFGVVDFHYRIIFFVDYGFASSCKYKS